MYHSDTQLQEARTTPHAALHTPPPTITLHIYHMMVWCVGHTHPHPHTLSLQLLTLKNSISIFPNKMTNLLCVYHIHGPV
jgi:hypothetical protein